MKVFRPSLEYMRRADFRALVREGLMSRDLGLPISDFKLSAFCDAVIKDHYGLVAEDDGVCVAYLGGVVASHYWFDRAQLNIVGWYSKRPFAGMRLLTEALAWAKGRPHIKAVMVTVNPEFDAQVRRVIERRGYAAHVVSSFLIEV